VPSPEYGAQLAEVLTGKVPPCSQPEYLSFGVLIRSVVTLQPALVVTSKPASGRLETGLFYLAAEYVSYRKPRVPGVWWQGAALEAPIRFWRANGAMSLGTHSQKIIPVT
jgi:hypothetical protein